MPWVLIRASNATNTDFLTGKGTRVSIYLVHRQATGFIHPTLLRGRRARQGGTDWILKLYHSTIGGMGLGWGGAGVTTLSDCDGVGDGRSIDLSASQGRIGGEEKEQGKKTELRAGEEHGWLGNGGLEGSML